MGWFSKKSSAKKEMMNQSFTTTEINTFLESLGFTGDVSADKLYSATYYACMDIRCKAISKLPIKVMKSGEFGTEKADKHYLYSLLKRRPNPYTSTIDLLYAAEFQKLEHGNAFIYAPVIRGKVVGLYLLNSERMTIYVDDSGIINNNNAIWYQYRDQNGAEHTFNYKEIIHLKNFTKDGLVGIPIKKYLAETIQNEQYATKFINKYWQNGVQGRAILQFTSNLDQAQVNKMREKWDLMTSGVKNAGRIIPVPLGFELKEFNPKLVDSQFFEMQGLTIRHIANAFGVKLYQLNDLERSTYGNVETQNRAFLSDTLQNVITQAEQEMDYKLLTTKELNDGLMIRFIVDSLLRSDFKTRMDGYAVAVQNGIYTPAECREFEDKPYIEGSDKLVVNGNIIPLDMAGQQYNKTQSE
jgi:HK97 family phage portal protein